MRAEHKSVWLLTCGLVAGALTLHVAVVAGLRAPVSDVLLPFWSLVLAFLVVEACVVHVQFGTQAHTFSVSEVPLVLGLFFADPQQLVAARLVGGSVALLVIRRQRLYKAAFNLALWWLATVVALSVWHVTAGTTSDTSGGWTWAATVISLAAAELLATLGIAAAMALQGDRWPGALPRGIAQAQLVSLINVSFALVAVDVVRADWRGVWSVIVLGAALAAANSAMLRLHQRRVALERLNSFAEGIAVATSLEEMLNTVVVEIRRAMEARDVELELAAEFAAAAGTAGRVVRDTDGDGVRPGDTARGDALTVVLRGASGTVGTLTIRNRLGDVGGFSADDMRLLQAVGRHAGERLCNGLLVERLRQHAARSEYEALHDPLTGLPNRVLFSRWVDEACESRSAAVLLLDLDRFKEVNDTLGHASGDEMLREVSRRLRLAAGEEDYVARLGGDEFAMLLRPGGEKRARALAEQVRRLLVQPVQMSAMSLTVQASVGISVCPEHGTDAATLLRKADVAMYVAKRLRTNTEVYSPSCDENTSLRLAVVGDLHRALAEDRFHLLYQPQARFRDRAVTGFEALIRWEDESRGLVGPDVFIPIAESVGLIGDITEWVVRTALARCRAWEQGGDILDVAVNVSPATLHDPGFVALLRRLLDESQLAPRRLTLEITEGAVMRDPVHAMLVLHELRILGVRLSIDDMGAGQSSLTYLRRLPVDEVKIDKSFVMGMSHTPDDDAVVCALVNLVHTLRLPVVAEGVEDAQTWARLRSIGCDTAQGYLLAEPLNGDDVPGWLRAWDARIDLRDAETVTLPSPTSSRLG